MYQAFVKFTLCVVFVILAVPSFAQVSTDDTPAIGPIYGETGDKWDDRIFEALRNDAEVDWFETRFEDCLNELASAHKIPILLDESAADNNLDGESLISRKLKGISLRSALRIVLDEYDCTYTVENGILTIRSETSARGTITSRAYDCRELISHMLGDKNENLEKLVKVITSNIDPQSWQTAGGFSGIAEVSGLLHVLQTNDNHERIEQKLNFIRQKLLNPTP